MARSVGECSHRNFRGIAVEQVFALKRLLMFLGAGMTLSYAITFLEKELKAFLFFALC